VSLRSAKRDIHYLDPPEAAALHGELLGLRLARYHYEEGSGGQHLGFIIDDQAEGSPAVRADRQQVDLYGYTSMAVAPVQVQQVEIRRLEAEIVERDALLSRLESRLEALESACR
jgi:hypothetical protein